MPYEQHIINKEIYKTNNHRNNRREYRREKVLGLTPMEYYVKIKGYRDNMVRGRTRVISPESQLIQTTLANSRRMLKP